MKKPATTEPYCQPHVELQLPLPLLSRLRAVREGFFELCIRVGEHALHALMELGLIRFRGHFPKGGYDVPDGATNQESAPTPAV